METVSNEWKQAQLETIVPVSFIEIKYNVGDPDSQADVSPTGTQSEYSNIAETVTQYTPKKYAFLEHNMWDLDGSCELLSVKPAIDIGYISPDISDSEGVFANPQIFNLTFTKVFTKPIPGVTIQWSTVFNEYATDFTITAYNGTTVTSTINITDNKEVISYPALEINNYNRIEIKVNKWSTPFRKARIEDILVGIEKIFSKTDLMTYSHEQYADILSADLPKNSVVFEIDNVSEEWNPDNPSAVYKYLIERQEITVKYGYKINDSIEWIKAGTFYMSEWSTPQNGITAKFTARDLIEFMNDKFVPSKTTYTLSELAIEALKQANLPLNEDDTTKWILDTSLSQITITLPEKFDHTIAETIQLVAHRGRCVMYQDRAGQFHIEPINNALTDYIINRFNSYKNAEYEITKELKSVDVNDGMGKATNSTTGEIQTVKNELITDTTSANNIATWIKDTLKHRKLVKGEFRADPRLDALDTITVVNKFASNKVIVTNVKYDYKGSFTGTYEGRAIDG